MMRRMLRRMLQGSGPCLDSPALLQVLARQGTLRLLALRLLRVKFTPLILPRLRALQAPLNQRARLFTEAISLINAGGTFKTTGENRTRLADAAILRLAQGLAAPRIFEVGASDGSASLFLSRELPTTATLILSDAHPEFFARRLGPIQLILTSDGTLLGVKLPLFYLHMPLGAQWAPAGCQRLDTLNPVLAEASQPNDIIPFNIFSDVLPAKAHIIKCANVLNRAYFSDAEIRAAVANLTQSLVCGGHLVISHNNARYADEEAFIILRRANATLELTEERNGHEALALFQERAACAS